MLQRQHHLPNIGEPNARDIRGLKRVVEQQQQEIKLSRIARENDRIQTLALFEARSQEQAQIDHQRRLDAAMCYLDRLNSKGDAHVNFHGIADAARIHQICESTIRRNYIKHRQASALVPSIPTVPLLDPCVILEAMVSRCITGNEKTSVVWSENEDKAVQLNCNRSTFYEIIKRRRLDPNAPIRLKLGRHDFVPPSLLNDVREKTRLEDLKGNSLIRISSGAGNKIQLPGYKASTVANSFQNQVLKSQKTILGAAGAELRGEYSDSTIRKIEKATKVPTITDSDKGCQNRRRYQAMNDPYNAFSRVIVYMLVELTVDTSTIHLPGKYI